MSSKFKPQNFLNLPEHLSNFTTAEVVILGVPYEASTTYGKGTKHGPQAIIDASSQLEWYDEELNAEPCQVGIATLMPFTEFDAQPERSVAQIAEVCDDLLQKKKFVVGIGGEHTITVAFVQAFKKFYPDMWVLQLDAHSDLRDSYHNSPLNHACVMARIGHLCPFLGLGIRSAVKKECDVLPAPSQIIYAHEMYQNLHWPDLVLEKLGDPVYITIDLDYFDPSVVPSVGTPEPGGFQWIESIKFLRKIARARQIVGFDVVELSPKPGFIASEFFAAKLIYKLIGYIFEEKIMNYK
ncbi:MAG: agmatinase [bacterium]